MLWGQKFFQVDLVDIGRGVVVAIGTAIAMVLVPICEAGKLPTMAQLQLAGIAAACAGIVYLLKNLFTNSKNQLFKTEPKDDN
jgi:hypothetical protein